jgi:hypothetical protein
MLWRSIGDAEAGFNRLAGYSVFPASGQLGWARRNRKKRKSPGSRIGFARGLSVCRRFKAFMGIVIAAGAAHGI